MSDDSRSAGPRNTNASGDDLRWLGKQARAHLAVQHAIRSGRLVRQPCEVCGAEKVDAHHDDYDKPLDVRWLCRLHHRHVHMQGPRKPPPFGVVTIRQLRSLIPDEPVVVETFNEGVREAVAVWIPIWMVDEP